MTPETAKKLCILAHTGQWRKPTKAKSFVGLPNSIITVLQQGDLKGYEHNGKRYSYQHGNVLTLLIQEPYHTHPIAVADMLLTDDEKIVAYLHEVIENTQTEIIRKGTHHWLVLNNVRYRIKENIYYALQCVSKRPEETYTEYIKDLSENQLACKIKITSMFHNMSTNISDKEKANYIKYIPILLAQI